LQIFLADVKNFNGFFLQKISERALFPLVPFTLDLRLHEKVTEDPLFVFPLHRVIYAPELRRAMTFLPRDFL